MCGELSLHSPVEGLSSRADVGVPQLRIQRPWGAGRTNCSCYTDSAGGTEKVGRQQEPAEI